MLTLHGSPALSPFRLQKLSADLVAAGLPIQAVSAEFVHVVDLAAELTPAERSVLDQLLTYGPRRSTAPIAAGLLQVIAPRPGTISPWSSKATDIAHICGLMTVKRIERVTAYTIDFGGTPVSSDLRAALAARLHDRMTQTVFNDLESLDVLFRHEKPRALTS